MNKKVIRYQPLHTQVQAHIPIYTVTSTQHMAYVHTHIHAHAQSGCTEDLRTVLEHRVKAVSLTSTLALGGRALVQSVALCLLPFCRKDWQSLRLLPAHPASPLLNLVLTTRGYTWYTPDSVPITHPLWNPREKTNSDTQPALSELFPASDPIPPTLRLSWLQFALENDRLLSLVDSSPALL